MKKYSAKEAQKEIQKTITWLRAVGFGFGCGQFWLASHKVVNLDSVKNAEDIFIFNN